MSKQGNKEAEGGLGLTIPRKTNETLARIKRKTGLSKSFIANIALAHIASEIDAGKLRIVNQTVEVAEPATA